MLPLSHPEVLSADWVPPVALRRQEPLLRLREWLGDPYPDRGLPWAAAVVGPAGSGTSTVARLAARSLADAVRREDAQQVPLLAAVRARWCRGPHGVATELLRRLDDGFVGRGFPIAEILAGFLRRIQRVRRPTIVVLHDLGPASPDIAPVARALAYPERFLPEGTTMRAPLWLILAGAPPDPEEATRWLPFLDGRWLQLGEYTEPDLAQILEDRARRALGRPPPEEWASRIAARSVREGRGATRALELLRRELTGGGTVRPSRWAAPGGEPLVVEPRLWRALDRALATGTATLGEVKGWEERFAREDGERPLPTTTFWRRVVRLEAAGIVRRSVRTGGAGGTRSTLELLTSIDDQLTPPNRPGSRPGSGLVAPPPPVWPGVPV